MSEDCLNLSVIAPENAANLPVLVWYHGGANISGGADIDLMDTSGLARLGLVTVCVQYRLGLYGCVEIPGHAPANLHVYDQMEALRWVNENVSAFGGDPSKVTIMGQSAGGWAVYNMLLAPTDGLFNKAIMISAPLGIKPKGGYGELVKKRLPGNLLDIQAECQIERDGIDDYTADRRQAPFPADLDKRIAERCKDVQLLAGWTADDCLPFLRLVPAGKAAISLPFIGNSLEYWIGKTATNFVFRRGNEQLAQKWSRGGGNATTFEFQWFPEGNPFRACHCIEMPFLFGGWATWAAAPLLVGKDSEEVVTRLAPRIKQMVLTFIEDGLKDGKHIEITGNFSEKSYL